MRSLLGRLWVDDTPSSTPARCAALLVERLTRTACSVEASRSRINRPRTGPDKAAVRANEVMRLFLRRRELR
jgi:hypothetical protein